MTEKALVTGGAGFIGSNLVLELEKKGYEVIVADNLSPGKEQNLKGFKGIFQKIDVSKPSEIKEKLDVIFHEAAITDPRFNDDKEMLRANLEGFKNMIALAKKNNAKLVYASTAALYGNGPVPMKEEQEKELLTAYAESKLEMDKLAASYFGSMHIVGLRYFNVFGPRQNPESKYSLVVPGILSKIFKNERPLIDGTGEQSRDFVFIGDVVDAFFKILGNKMAYGKVYNLGFGRTTSVNTLTIPYTCKIPRLH